MSVKKVHKKHKSEHKKEEANLKVNLLLNKNELVVLVSIACIALVLGLIAASIFQKRVVENEVNSSSSISSSQTPSTDQNQSEEQQVPEIESPEGPVPIILPGQ